MLNVSLLRIFGLLEIFAVMVIFMSLKIFSSLTLLSDSLIDTYVLPVIASGGIYVTRISPNSFVFVLLKFKTPILLSMLKDIGIPGTG